VIAAELLVREEKEHKKKGKKAKRKPKYEFGPDNEHTRWETGAAIADQRLRKVGCRAIHVMDREGDSYLLLVEMLKNERSFVIRATQNRALNREKAPWDPLRPKAKEPPLDRISTALAGLPPLAEREIRISSRSSKNKAPATLKKHPAREERSAKIIISATSMDLKRPHAAPTRLPASLQVNVVHVHEPHPPAGEEPVEWTLLTREAIDTPADVERVVDIYRRRWIVEEFFKALKSGCSVENRAFHTAHALKNVCAISVPMAWQMLLLRSLARQPEPRPAKQVLSPIQLTVLKAATTHLPRRIQLTETPTIQEALHAIAALGGFVRTNAEPGWITLARGFQELLKLEQGFLLAPRGGESPCLRCVGS
jgi:hypothetical protein